MPPALQGKCICWGTTYMSSLPLWSANMQIMNTPVQPKSSWAMQKINSAASLCSPTSFPRLNVWAKSFQNSADGRKEDSKKNIWRKMSLRTRRTVLRNAGRASCIASISLRSAWHFASFLKLGPMCSIVYIFFVETSVGSSSFPENQSEIRGLLHRASWYSQSGEVEKSVYQFSEMIFATIIMPSGVSSWAKYSLSNNMLEREQGGLLEEKSTSRRKEHFGCTGQSSRHIMLHPPRRKFSENWLKDVVVHLESSRSVFALRLYELWHVQMPRMSAWLRMRKRCNCGITLHMVVKLVTCMHCRICVRPCE